ncbi:hypothetical protein LSAT2_032969 [Lamellibrachia satsuma]|nr:hypothetical protein LSAT2_032969 [Lamellibrachia satsuma]
MRKIQEDRMRRQAVKEEYWMRRDAEEQWREEMRMMMHEEGMFQGMYHGAPGWQGPLGRGGNFPPHGNMPGAIVRRPDSSDDRHVMSKHTSIYPNEAELQAVQQIVSNCEKALKQVSDFLSDSDGPKPVEVKKEPVIKKEPGMKKDDKEETTASESEPKPESQPPIRALKGVMRVGVLAKGLLLHCDLSVHLVVLCSEKPTRTLLVRVADNLPKQLARTGVHIIIGKLCCTSWPVLPSSSPHWCIADIHFVDTLLEKVMRLQCQGFQALQLKVVDSDRKGFAVRLKLVCCKCTHEVSSTYSSPHITSSKRSPFTINDTMVQFFRRLGLGHTAVKEFCGILGIPAMHLKTF